MNSRFRFLFGCVGLGLVFVCAPAVAQISDADATKALQSEVKSEIKDVKAAIKAEVAALDATLKALTADAKDGTFGATQELVLGEALKDFEESLLLNTFLQLIDIVVLMDEVLPETSTTGGIYPADFYFGSGSAIGRFESALQSEYAKALAKLDKRFAKLAGELEKSGIGFTWRLIFEKRGSAVSYNPTGGAPGQPNRLSLSVVYAFSDFDTAGDGRLCVVGFAPNTVSDIDIELIGGEPELTVLETTVGEGDAVLFHCFADLGEGNYLIEVKVQDDSDSRFTSLGVR